MVGRPRAAHEAAVPALGLEALGQMMPLFLWLDPALRIRAAGPTLHKIWAATQPKGEGHAQTSAGAGARASGAVATAAPDITERAREAADDEGAPDSAGAGRDRKLPGRLARAAVPLRPGTHGPASLPQPDACGHGLVGRALSEVFDLQRPRHLLPDASTPQRLRLCLRAFPHTPLRGIAVPLAGTARRPDGLFVNLSFGIAVADAVRAHGLTDSDFAATDLAVELLYLQEANAAVLQELRGANGRLVTAKASAEAQASTDALTGLHNRRAMDRALIESTRAGAPFGLMHVDLDFFKQVNDSLGHAAGDHVLAEVARGLREETRAGDIVARVGGDEFVLLFPGLTDRAALSGIAARIIRRLEQPILWEGQICRVSASIGFTASTLYVRPEPDRLLSDADHALYHSKRTGRGVATPFGPDLRPPG